jgi:hypothetical protein
MRVLRLFAVSTCVLLAIGSAAIFVVVLLHSADVWPFGFRGIRLWESWLEAVLGAAAAVAATAVGVLAAKRLVSRNISAVLAVSLSAVLAVLSIAGSLVYLGASSVAYTPVVETVTEPK